MKLSFLVIVLFTALCFSISCKKKTYLCECQEDDAPNKGAVLHTIHATSKKKAAKECSGKPVASGFTCALQ